MDPATVEEIKPDSVSSGEALSKPSLIVDTEHLRQKKSKSRSLLTAATLTILTAPDFPTAV